MAVSPTGKNQVEGVLFLNIYISLSITEGGTSVEGGGPQTKTKYSAGDGGCSLEL